MAHLHLGTCECIREKNTLHCTDKITAHSLVSRQRTLLHHTVDFSLVALFNHAAWYSGGHW